MSSKESSKTRDLSEIEINIQLREKMLKSWLALSHSVATLKMYEDSTVFGEFIATDGKQEKLQLSNMQTPMFFYEDGLIRTSDVMYMKINSSNSLDEKNEKEWYQEFLSKFLQRLTCNEMIAGFDESP